MLWREERSGGRTCCLCGDEGAAYVLLQAVGSLERESLEREAAAIGELAPGRAFLLAAFQAEDWNSALSPWPAPPAFGPVPFGRGAAETLAFVLEWLPRLRALSGGGGCFLGGYSLAGLFALWAAYQTAAFDGVAAVSPSLWFPGWDAFAERERMGAPLVYLSLGDREEKTKNKAFAAIGDCLRRQAARLERDGHVQKSCLEWNPGNHFMEPERRTAKGFAWLLRNAGGIKDGGGDDASAV